MILYRKFQNGGTTNNWVSYLNPYNWGVSEFNDKGFSDAYKKAKMQDLDEFMWTNPKTGTRTRYNTEMYVPTPKRKHVESTVVPGTYIANKLGIEQPTIKKDTTYVDLTDAAVDYARNGEFVKGKTILGGDFVDTKHNNIRSAYEYRKYKPRYILNHRKHAYKHPDDSTTFYGVENGKLKIGNYNDFNDKTILVPVRFGSAYDKFDYKQGNSGAAPRLAAVTNKDTLSINFDPKYEGFASKGKILLYDPVTGKKAYVFGDTDYVKDKANAFKQKNNDARYILLDNGRFAYYVRNKKGLTNRDYEKYNASTIGNARNNIYNLILK